MQFSRYFRSSGHHTGLQNIEDKLTLCNKEDEFIGEARIMEIGSIFRGNEASFKENHKMGKTGDRIVERSLKGARLFFSPCS